MPPPDPSTYRQRHINCHNRDRLAPNEVWPNMAGSAAGSGRRYRRSTMAAGTVDGHHWVMQMLMNVKRCEVRYKALQT